MNTYNKYIEKYTAKASTHETNAEIFSRNINKLTLEINDLKLLINNKF
jgi:hypothetical protein